MGQSIETITWASIKRASQWSPAQARWVIAELKRSGLGAKRFSDKHALGIKRLYYWHARMLAQGQQGETRRRVTSKGKLVEVSLPASTVSPSRVAPGRVEIELRCGRRLSVAETIHLDTLAPLVALLERV